MTIRDYIRRRVWWCAAIAFGGWLLLPLSVAAAGDKPPPVLMAIGVILFGGAILAFYWVVRCPKCKTRLINTVGMAIAFQWGSRGKVNFCPYCGVNLDEPVPRAQSVEQSQNPIHPA